MIGFSRNKTKKILVIPELEYPNERSLLYITATNLKAPLHENHAFLCF